MLPRIRRGVQVSQPAVPNPCFVGHGPLRYGSVSMAPLLVQQNLRRYAHVLRFAAPAIARQLGHPPRILQGECRIIPATGRYARHDLGIGSRSRGLY
jgi:hypothetical protein